MKRRSFIVSALLISSLSSCFVSNILPGENSKPASDSGEKQESLEPKTSTNSDKTSIEIQSISSVAQPSEVDEEALENAIRNAIEELETYVNLDKYRAEEKEKIQKLIEKGKTSINSAETVDDVFFLLDFIEESIRELKTDADYKKEAYDSCKTTSQIEEYKKFGYSSIFKDSNYKKGFRLSKTKQIPGSSFYYDTKPLNPFGRKDTPVWDIAQWDCKYDFLGTDSNGGYTLEQDIDGVVNRYISKGKTIDGKFVPGKVFEANSKTGELYIEQNGRAEYDKAKAPSDPWPCILFQQGFDDSLVHVATSESIIMEVDYQVHSCTNYCGQDYNYNAHAAQLVWYVTIQNRSGGFSNPDYGKYIWFGLMLYDDRYDNKVSNLYRAHDAGTGTLIYNLSSTEYLKSNDGKVPTVGKRVKAKIDIVPYIKTTMEFSKQNGYLGNTQYEDLYVSGMNFGYEIPGRFDISSTIYSINLFTK